jgi:hypothetical protein
MLDPIKVRHAIASVAKNITSVIASNDGVIQSAFKFYSGLARHYLLLFRSSLLVNNSCLNLNLSLVSRLR